MTKCWIKLILWPSNTELPVEEGGRPALGNVSPKVSSDNLVSSRKLRLFCFLSLSSSLCDINSVLTSSLSLPSLRAILVTMQVVLFFPVSYFLLIPEPTVFWPPTPQFHWNSSCYGTQCLPIAKPGGRWFFTACDILWTLNPIPVALAIPLVLWNYTFQVFLVSPWPFLLFDRLLFLYPLLISFPGCCSQLTALCTQHTLPVASATTCTLTIPKPLSLALTSLQSVRLFIYLPTGQPHLDPMNGTPLVHHLAASWPHPWV